MFFQGNSSLKVMEYYCNFLLAVVDNFSSLYTAFLLIFSAFLTTYKLVFDPWPTTLSGTPEELGAGCQLGGEGHGLNSRGQGPTGGGPRAQLYFPSLHIYEE